MKQKRSEIENCTEHIPRERILGRSVVRTVPVPVTQEHIVEVSQQISGERAHFRAQCNNNAFPKEGKVFDEEMISLVKG